MLSADSIAGALNYTARENSLLNTHKSATGISPRLAKFIQCHHRQLTQTTNIRNLYVLSEHVLKCKPTVFRNKVTAIHWFHYYDIKTHDYTCNTFIFIVDANLWTTIKTKHLRVSAYTHVRTHTHTHTELGGVNEK